MQLEKKLYCHWDLVRFVSEQDLLEEKGYTISVTCNNKYELMIFLGCSEEGNGYEVIVYKADPTNKYVPKSHDNVVRYEENDEYVTFYFDNYEHANSFTYLLCHIHPEYRKRPAQMIPNT